MREYSKIETIWNRDSKTFKVIEGEYRTPEFEYLANNIWEVSEKIDGTNTRIEYKDGVFNYGGRTDNAQIPTFLLSRLQEITRNGSWDFPDGVCLYGEGYGAKIQKGGGNYKADGVDFILFDVLIGDWWLKTEDVAEIAHNLGLEQVPQLCCCSLIEASGLVKNGLQSTFGNFQAEGVVLKPIVSLFTRRGDRIVGKIKTKDFA